MAMTIFLSVSPNIVAGEVHEHTDFLEDQDANVAPVTERNEFKGKKVSILSASTATYAGVPHNTSANSTIGKNDV